MNKPLAELAIKAVTAPSGFTKRRQECKIWVRQVVWQVYGDDRWREVLGAGYTPDAASSGRALVRAGLDVPNRLEEGDLLVWYAGEYGHIAIYVGDGRIAENYSPHAAKNGGDARGFRRVTNLSPWDVQARLPAPDAPAAPLKLYTLRLRGVPIAQMPIIEGRAWAPVRPWARALGLEVVWDGAAKRVSLGGHDYPAEPMLIDGASHFPVRDLARWSGLAVEVDEAARSVEVVRP